MTNPLVNLVQTNGQQAFTTSLVIAEGCPTERKDRNTGTITAHERDHRDVLKLVKQYLTEFEEFGGVRFQTAQGVRLPQGGFAQSTEYAILNEDQATYLITLFNNTTQVRKFKRDLVKAFRAALNHIAKNFADPPRTGLITDKRMSMWDMTDALKEIRAENGKLTEAHHYANENKLINWCITGKFAKLDEKSLSNEEVDICKKLRIKNAAFIRADMEYAERKTKLKAYAERLRDIKLIS